MEGAIWMLMRYSAVGEDYCTVIQKHFLPRLAKDMSTLRFSDVPYEI